MTYAVIIIFFILICGVVLMGGGDEEKKVQRRLEELLRSQNVNPDNGAGLERRHDLSRVPFLNRILQKIRRMSQIGLWLRQSGLPLTPGAFVLIFLFTTSLFAFTSLFFGQVTLAVLISTCTGAYLPVAFVSYKRKKRLANFSRIFPDAIAKMSSSLRAGYSLQMALETVVKESNDIVAQEFREVLAEMEFGQSFEKSMQKMVERVDTADLRLFIASLSIQRESGGNLTELLDNLESTIRERYALMQELNAATAQGRLSGFVLGGLPIFVGIAVYVINPGYMGFFFDDPVGKNLLWCSIAGQLLGFYVIRKLVSIDM